MNAQSPLQFGRRATDRAGTAPPSQSSEYLIVLYKRRWAAGSAFLSVVMAVTVYTFTATPIYEARARVLIEADNPNVVSFKQVVEQDQGRADYYQTQYSLLQSRSLARRTLDTLKLWDDVAMIPGQDAASGISGVAARSISRVGRFFEDRPKPVPPADGSETEAQARAIDGLLGALTVTPVRSSRIVEVSFRSADPGMAARVVNAHVKGYIEQTMEFKFLTSKEASDWLAARLAEQRKQVEEAEAAVQRYREQNGAMSFDDTQNIVVQKLAELNAAVTRAKTERIQKEALFRQMQSVQNDRAALDAVPAILSNTFIQQQKSDLADLQTQYAQLSEKLGERHPDIIKVRSAIQAAQSKLQGEIAKVVQSVRNEYLASQAQERSLTEALDQQKAEALAMNRKAIDYGVLVREAESSRQVYESLLQRAKETGVSAELRTSNIRIVDAAELPRVPVSPNRRSDLLIGLLGGLLFAFGLTVFFERIDSRIKRPDDIEMHLRLPSLGLIPRIAGKNDGAGLPLISNGVPAAFSESFGSLRTNVVFSSAEDGPRSIVVTSTRPSEGKSVVAANLAIGFANSGQRVLLIDGDLRRPKLHEAFKVRQQPGLSNLLVGNTKASEAVVKTSTPGLWLLPAGKIPPNPAELLGSRRFQDFLASLGEHFQFVVLDSPPVMAVADASVLSHRATSVIFVVGAEMTSRHAAATAVQQLLKARARVIGAVLNRADVTRNPYYYSKHYRPEYAKYYSHT